MSKDYREQLEWCLTCGEKVTFSYKEYSRQNILKELQGCLRSRGKGYEEPYMREEVPVDDMLWILTPEELMEKGPYYNNQPLSDVAIVAPPPFMALLMGEYELAMELCEEFHVTSWKNRADEVYLSDGIASMGSRYSFGEACMLCEDMSASQLLFFVQRDLLETGRMLADNRYLYETSCFRLLPGYEWERELLWRPFYAVKKLDGMSEKQQELLGLLTDTVVHRKVDIKYPKFWERLFDMFTKKEERLVIVETVHNYFYGSINYIFSERFQNVLLAYFRCEEELPMVGAIKKYIVERVITESSKGSHFHSRLTEYFGTVKNFGGKIDKEWKEGMLNLLKLNREDILLLGFQCGFLKKECIEEYVTLLSEKQNDENYTYTIMRLIQMRWRTALK